MDRNGVVVWRSRLSSEDGKMTCVTSSLRSARIESLRRLFFRATLIAAWLFLCPAVYAQSIFTVAGGGTADGRPATLTGLYRPSGVALDAAGNLYIADTNNYVIHKVAAGSGIISTVAGSGSGGYSGDGGPATAASLREPSGVAVDAAGNLYITDFGRIRKVTAGSGIISTVAPSSINSFVAVDAAGNLYFTDGRIRKVAAGSGIISTVAGNGIAGFSGDGGPATAASLSDPSGVAFDAAGNLYIADNSNNRIRKVEAGSGIISTVSGNGTAAFLGDGGPATAAELDHPYGVAVDAAGKLYITDRYNNRIRRVDAGSGIISTVVGSGAGGFWGGNFSGDGGPATAATLRYPSGVALDAAGNLYIADWGNDRIRQVAAGSGIMSTVAGNGTHGILGDGGPATAAGLFDVAGVALDAAGNLYIADALHIRIRKVAAGSGIISTVAGNGGLGSSGDGGPATAATFVSPEGVALDAAGNLYIADRNNHRIRKVDAGSGIISTVAGSGPGSSFPGSFSGDGGPATAATLNGPYGVAPDSRGNLYIADMYNHRIREVAAGSGILSTVAGNGVTQQNGAGTFSGDGGPATAAGLSYPSGVALDAAGNLYIADRNNHRIRIVSAGSGIISTVAGNGGTSTQNGVGTFSGDGGPATSAGLNYPYAVAFDASGNMYIADSGNSRVRKVAARSGIISTVAGSGLSGSFSGDGGPATAAGLGSHAVAVDAPGNLFISDGSIRVRVVFACVTVAAPALTLPSNGSQGVTSSAELAWSPVKGAFHYDVYVDTMNPPQRVIVTDFNATSFPICNLEHGTTYYWKIAAKGDPFCPSPSIAASEVRSFTTASACDAAPELISN
jgi:trimeric autotransporter adhesin